MEEDDSFVSQALLDSFNVEQCGKVNYENLENYGGTQKLASELDVSTETGLFLHQVLPLRERYGSNVFPCTRRRGVFELLVEGK